MKERSLNLFRSFSVAIPIQAETFPHLKKRKKCAHNFQPVKLFPFFFFGNLDLRERVCMVYVNIVG